MKTQMSQVDKEMSVKLGPLRVIITLKLNAHDFQINQQLYCKNSGPNRRTVFDEWGFGDLRVRKENSLKWG